jgi:hypothetical protein
VNNTNYCEKVIWLSTPFRHFLFSLFSFPSTLKALSWRFYIFFISFFLLFSLSWKTRLAAAANSLIHETLLCIYFVFTEGEKAEKKIHFYVIKNGSQRANMKMEKREKFSVTINHTQQQRRYKKLLLSHGTSYESSCIYSHFISLALNSSHIRQISSSLFSHT